MPAVPRALEFLAISGSLRHASSNSALLRAAAMLAPPGTRITPFEGLGGLPYFNPDLDTNPPPPAVRDFRERIAAADGLVISSPEYAHGVPGVLKNALDWLVGGDEIVGKPVGLLNASPRAVHAQASLVEILQTMAAGVVPAARVSVPLLGRNLDAAAIAADPELAVMVYRALAALASVAEAQPRSVPRSGLSGGYEVAPGGGSGCLLTG
jgi:Predicted flavoprotein